MIKNIIFDIGGVLAAFDPIKILREMGLEEDEVQLIAEKTLLGPWWIELDRGVIDKEEVFSRMLSDLALVSEKSVPVATKFLHEQIVKTVTSYDYSASLLRELKSKGYKIYLLTNYPSWLFDYHWKNTFSFTESVDGAFVSGKEKMIKPDDEIYQGILSRFSLKAEECVFLDDRIENIQGAQRNGIQGIHFVDFNSAKKALDQLLK